MNLAPRSLLFALALAGALAGCGDDTSPAGTTGTTSGTGGAGGGTGGTGGAGGAGGAGPAPVEGTSTRHYVTDAGEVTAPADLTNTDINAWVPGGATGFEKFVGSGSADGTFTIPGVPEGSYYLEVRSPGAAPSFRVTSSRTPALDSYLLGRPDAVDAADGTSLVLDVTGLSPWKDEDDNVLFSTNAGAIGFSLHLNATAGAPMPGDTAFAGMDVDYAAVYAGGLNTPRLIEASKGDVAHFVQLVFTTSPEGDFFRLERHCASASIEMVSGQSAPFSCALAEVPQAESFPIRVSRAGFEGQLANVHPTATIRETEIVVRALPGAVAHGLYSGSPELIIFEAVPGAADIEATIPYGNPFPPEWDLYATYLTAFSIPVLAPGSATPLDFRVQLRNDVPLSAVDGGLVEPLVTPVKDLRVNGLPAFEEHTGVTAQPVISWTAPDQGRPGYYAVLVYRIYDQGGTTKRALAGRIETTDTSVTIPPGVMDPGEQYLVQVTAWTATGLPLGGAPVVSSLMAPR